MKTRVKIKNGKYVPQIKTWFWWASLSGGFTSEIPIACDTLEEALDVLRQYKNQRVGNGTIVYESNSK